MEIDKKLFFIAFLITITLFFVILVVTSVMNNERQGIIDERTDLLLSEYKDMETINLLSEIYGEEFFCIGLKKKLEELDKYLWDTGSKIENYQDASSTFVKDQSYVKQKKTFNQNEIYYLALFKNFQKKCNWSNKVIFYFYRNSKDCPDCDAQSFVLTDIKQSLDQDVAIFSFDMDLGLSSLESLNDYYKIKEYPCVIVDEKAYCGLRDKKEILEILCQGFNIDYCENYQ